MGANSNELTPPRLSAAERKVMIMILRGASLKAIGETLGISAKTVSTYKTRIMNKMNAQNNAELVIQGMMVFGIGGILLDE